MAFSGVEGFPDFGFVTLAKFDHHCPVIGRVVACDVANLWATGH
jgi:hypothetical protein